MTTNIGFAILGCGRIAQRHAQVLSHQVDGARLVAVCDVISERADKLGAMHGVPAFTDIHEMMRAVGDQIDVVNICTPTGCHAANALDVAEYRKHVVVEKPMTLTLEDADAIVRRCDEMGVRLFVVKQNRLNVPVRKLHEAIQAGRFGKIVQASVRVLWSRKQSYYDQDSWRGTWEWNGGVFANQASHHIDLLTWLVSDVDAVFSYTARRLLDIECEDTGAGVLKFQNGAIGLVQATTATRPRDIEASISILGEGGVVEIGGFAVNHINRWEFVEPLPEDDDIRTKFNENPPDIYGFGHQEYMRRVVESVRDGRAGAVADGLEGIKSLRVINAFYESAELQREVKLRWEPTRVRLGMRGRRRNDVPAVYPGTPESIPASEILAAAGAPALRNGLATGT